MKSKKSRAIKIGEEIVYFDLESFKYEFRERAKLGKHKIGEYEQIIADVVCLDKSSIHNWRNNLNGTGDLEVIKRLADFWKISYKCLLIKEDMIFSEEDKMSTQNAEERKFTDREKAIIREVYLKVRSYAKTFVETGSFTGDTGEEEVYLTNMQYDLLDEIREAIENEYIDLYATVYDRLIELVDNEFHVNKEPVWFDLENMGGI